MPARRQDWNEARNPEFLEVASGSNQVLVNLVTRFRPLEGSNE